MTTKKYGTKELEKEFGPLTLGEALEGYRMSNEITQAELAKKIGISQQSLCDIEKSRRIPSPARAAKIAKAIGHPVSFWVTLGLQDELRKYNLQFDVKLIPAKAA